MIKRSKEKKKRMRIEVGGRSRRVKGKVRCPQGRQRGLHEGRRVVQKPELQPFFSGFT